MEKWLYVVPDVYGRVGNNVIHRQALDDALKKYNKFRVDSGEPELDVPAGLKQRTKAYYKFLSQFIIFANEKGQYEEPRITGEGKHIKMRAPAMQFNDIRNDPYFIIK